MKKLISTLALISFATSSLAIDISSTYPPKGACQIKDPDSKNYLELFWIGDDVEINDSGFKTTGKVIEAYTTNEPHFSFSVSYVSQFDNDVELVIYAAGSPEETIYKIGRVTYGMSYGQTRVVIGITDYEELTCNIP